MVLQKFYKMARQRGRLRFREFCVLWLAAHDKLNKDIASYLKRSEKHVERIAGAVCRQLGAHNMKGAINNAWKKGILNEWNS